MTNENIRIPSPQILGGNYNSVLSVSFGFPPVTDGSNCCKVSKKIWNHSLA